MVNPVHGINGKSGDNPGGTISRAVSIAAWTWESVQESLPSERIKTQMAVLPLRHLSTTYVRLSVPTNTYLVRRLLLPIVTPGIIISDAGSSNDGSIFFLGGGG
jgi:hypothetical protein